MLSVQDWKAAKCAKAEDADHIRAIEALASLLEGSMTPADAAKEITTAYTGSLKATRGGSVRRSWYQTKLSDFWGTYMSNAIGCFGTTEMQARLISLLSEISRLPDLKDDDGVVVKTIYHQVFWSDLPGWGFEFANAGLYLARSSDYSTEEREDFLAEIPRVINATRFAAKLLQKGTFAFALPLEATCCLKIGLEFSYDSSEGPDADEFPLLIPAATTWLLIAGETIYEHCSNGDTSNGWHQGPWNLQRWELWKRQLTSFAGREDFDEECRELAEQTAKKMAEIEKDFQGRRAVSARPSVYIAL